MRDVGDRTELIELRKWAEAFAPAGLAQARQVLMLFDEVARLQTQIAGHVERIAQQSELLTRKAEVK